MKKLSVLVIILFITAAACAINPVTGKKELSLFSEQQEIALGQNTDEEIRRQFGVYDDPDLLAYIESVGKRLVPHTHRPHLDYKFAVLDTPVINAFAVPGGFIYVTRGILALMNSEAELSVVLGHELGHVTARHGIRKLSKILLVQVGLAVGGALSDTFAKISGVASVGIQLLFLKYSRDDEREADALGIEYARKGSYNPAEMIDFFVSLQKLGDLSGGHGLPGFLSTHPLNSERIRNVQLMLQETDLELAVKEEPYLRRLDGIVFGEDPRQGYVESHTFYHPQLRFFFSVPQDWEVQNTPAQVGLTTKDGNAAVILQAEKSEESLNSYAQKKAAGLEGKYFIREDGATINGLAGFHQVYDIIQEEKETLRLRFTFIKKDGFIYTFSALSTALNFSKYDPVFQAVVNSFGELKNPKFINRQPKRLRLAKADGGQTLQELFRGAGLDKDFWPKAALLNGMEPGGTPRKSQLIKIVK